jgi:DNA primase
MSEHVQELLKKKDIYFIASGKDYLIKCLNPEHEDSNPSCRIDKVTGATHCFACGFKTNIFKFFGLTGNHTSIKVAKLKEKLKELSINSKGVEFPGEQIPMIKTFRGISPKTLKEFGAFYTHEKEELEDRLFFPIRDLRGKAVVYVGRHMLSSGNPRYLNYPSGARIPMYPEVYKDKYESAVLVEGMFDMLNLYDKGMQNVSCCFGTNTLQKDTASKLLPLRTLGVRKIYLMFDGDEAGRTAMDKLQPLIEEIGFQVEKINLEDDTDPGELDQESVDSIKEWINGNTNTA